MARFGNFICSGTIALAVAGAVLSGSGPAMAQMKGNFAAADANHDGRVTLLEFQAYATNRLMAVNGPRAQRFKQLSPQDQAARLQRRFERMDVGHKGYLVPSDWKST